MRPVLVTGAAGFIGFHVSRRLLGDGIHVVGVDNVNDYYDVSLKNARLAILSEYPGFSFEKVDLADIQSIERTFRSNGFETVVHLAAQAGVRYSLENPSAYVESNIKGFLHILEQCRHFEIKHLVYASSSSVYGANTHLPFSVHDNVDHPISLYAASKKSNELMAHAYSHLFRLPTTGLRFFTVYGPWGRPDMALFRFTEAILAGKSIQIFNQGDMQRDFTYIDDIVDGIARILVCPATVNPAWDSEQPDPASSSAPWKLYNIGNNRPVQLIHMIETLEKCLGRKAIKQYLPMQPGDVHATFADIDDLSKDHGYHPRTSIEVGIEKFVAWYLDYVKLGPLRG